MSETLRDLSKKTWFPSDNTLASINAGSMQRIADATEKMAQRHTDLMRDRDWYERAFKEAARDREALKRQLSAAKGQITKLRNAAKKDTQS